MQRRLVTVLIAAAALAAGLLAALLPGAGARTGPPPTGGGPPPPSGLRVEIQALFDRHGNPLATANFSPDGSLAKPHWTICRPGGACTAVASQVAQPGSEPAGTVFTAQAVYAGQTYTAAVTWRGRVQALTRPRLRGAARVGAIVRAIPGRWTGGWGTERNALTVEACRTRGGHRCVVLGHGSSGCMQGAASRVRIAHRWAERYLFALDARYAPDEVCAGSLLSHPPVWPVNQLTSRSRPRGPVS